MKKILYYITLAAAVISCNFQTPKQRALAEEIERQRIQDSIKQQNLLDSIKMVKDDSLSLIVWGDLKFGMSKKEVRKSPLFNDANIYDDSYAMDMHKEYSFQSAMGLSKSPSIWVRFKGSPMQLYEMEINCGIYDWNELESLKRDISRYVSEFTRIYGEPYYAPTKIEDLSWSYLTYHEDVTIAWWKVGTSTTKNIIITAEYKSLYCGYEISITNDAFPKKTQAEIKAEEENRAKKAAEIEAIKSMSF